LIALLIDSYSETDAESQAQASSPKHILASGKLDRPHALSVVIIGHFNGHIALEECSVPPAVQLREGA